MPSSLQVANHLLAAAENAEQSLTPMQLLKLVYICHGWMLGLYNEALVDDEIQAWRYGPVIPVLYNAIREFRSDPVVGQLAVRRPRPLQLHEIELIDDVFDKYGHLSGIKLSRMTHQPGTPWALTYDPDYPNRIIPNDLIEDHYEELAERSIL